jgi:hypothetical protein
MDLDQANEVESKRGVELALSRTAKKPDKARAQVGPIDPERLFKAIRYLHEHPKR